MKQEEKTKQTEIETSEIIDEMADETPQSELEVSTDEPSTTSDDLMETNKSTRYNLSQVRSKGWLSYLITSVTMAIITILLAWWFGGFDAGETQDLLHYWCDAFCVPGILGVCFGLLVVASNGGMFDMLVYGVRKLFLLMKRDPVDRKYGTYYEYRESRKEKKRHFEFLLIVGGAYLLVGIALLVAYYLV